MNNNTVFVHMSRCCRLALVYCALCILGLWIRFCQDSSPDRQQPVSTAGSEGEQKVLISWLKVTVWTSQLLQTRGFAGVFCVTSASAEGCPNPQSIQSWRAPKQTVCRLPESLLGVQTWLIEIPTIHCNTDVMTTTVQITFNHILIKT